MTNNERIEAYLTDSLNETEREEFLSELENNPDLDSEFKFQSDVVNGLKDARAAELKARLDAVKVGGNITSAISVGKAALIALTIGTGVFIYWNSSNDKRESLALEPKEIETNIEDIVIKKEEPSYEEVIVAEEKNEAPSSEHRVEELEDSNETEVVSKSPEINKPHLVEPLDISDDTDSTLEPNAFKSEDVTELSNIEVEIDNSKKKHSFHYQFKEGKLFLFGDFDQELYEILEINSNGGKLLYLFYQEKYFGLNKKATEITKLEEVNNSSLKRELEKIREQ